jgi:hypothetical protein
MTMVRWIGMLASAGVMAASGAMAQTAAPIAQASPQCRQLLADYGRIQSRAAASDPVGDAMARQQAALQRAEADYDRMCGPGLFSKPAAICPDIAQRINEMQANIQRMGASNRRGYNDPTLEQDRARVVAALRAAGCGPAGAAPAPQPQQAAAPRPVAQPPGSRVFVVQTSRGPEYYREDPGGRVSPISPPTGQQPSRMAASQTPPGLRSDPEPTPGGFFGALFGGNRPPRPSASFGYPQEADPLLPEDGVGFDEGGSGSYRTLCVRTCDGYYFPVSNSASPSRFQTDADICRARCPASETRLFVHPSGSESETAVAADDMFSPYAKMSYALKYRTEYVKDCTCGRPDPSLLPLNASAEDGARSQYGAVKVGDLRPDMPFPDAKPRLDDDPDSRWNEIAGFRPVVGPLAQSVAASAPQKPGERKVRVVGPKFFVAR